MAAKKIKKIKSKKGLKRLIAKKKKTSRRVISKRHHKIKKASPRKKGLVKTLTKKHEPMARLLLPLGRIKEVFRTRYGFFLYDGSEFVINTPETPTPWCNILTNGDYGIIISQTGGGVSFKGGIGNRITQWQQDLKSDSFGKYVYIRDNQTQQFWSATWKPVCKQPDFYEVRHGIGYTNVSSRNNGIISSLIYYVAAEEPVEIWQMRIKNDTDQERFLSVFTYLEWDFGYPTTNREYNKLFVETSFDEELSAIFAKTPQQHYAFHSANHKATTFSCGRDSFLGLYHDASRPRCVEKGMCFGEQGRYNDPAAAIHIDVDLPPRGEKELLFTVGISPSRQEAEAIIKKYKNVKIIEQEFSRACQRWGLRLSNFYMITPNEGMNIMNNKWFRYQAISAGLSCFGSYTNPKGTVNFKDHLLNGLILLSINPKYYRTIILNCAKKEFADGMVIDEWDPKTQRGKKSESLEVPLWLIYAVCEYLKETMDTSILDEEVKFQDVAKNSLFVHCLRVLNRSLDAIGKKGLPSMHGVDYMERLDEVWKEEKGESVWLGEFIVYLLSEFIKVCNIKKEKTIAAEYENRLKKIREKIKKVSWDNDRFIRAVTHTNRAIGISSGKNARLFLDTQIWAVISNICEKDEAKAIMDTVKSRLYNNYAPSVLSPSFTEYEKDIGTLSTLPVGVLENGGLSIETACWAIWAEVKLGRSTNAWSIYTRLDPVERSIKSDVYKLEPYVSCGYIDGPEAPTSGRGRDSWYNRSAYWMFKVMTEEILGIKPTFDGLVISPCIPERWKLFKVRRAFRNAYYNIEVVNPRYVSSGVAEIVVDGKVMKSNLIPAFSDEKRHQVKVVMGRTK